MATQLNTRGLLRVFVKTQGVYVYVWCHDDGELDRNHRLCYAVVSSPSDFTPAQGIFITVPAGSSYRFVYGVPEVFTENSGSLKLIIHDLTCALGFPRQANTNPTTGTGISIAGKVLNGDSPYCGEYLEGQFTQMDSTNGSVNWVQKDQNYFHAHRSPILEITDTATVTEPYSDDTKHGPAAPSGVIAVEYDRDYSGRILCYSNGTPKVRKIVDTGPDVAQNHKIGYVALKFEKDYFGIGVHGWIGSGGDAIQPFDLTASGTTVTVWPGTVSGILPSNIFDELTISATGTVYIVLTCTTNGKSLTAVVAATAASPPTPVLASSAGGQTNFTILIGVIKDSVKYQVRRGNITVSLSEAFKEDKTSPTPGTLTYIPWYTWTY